MSFGVHFGAEYCKQNPSGFVLAGDFQADFRFVPLWSWAKLEGPRRERKVSMLHLIGKQFEVVRDAVEFPIIMRNLHFVEDRVHVTIILNPGILISDEHGNRNAAPDLRGIGA